MSASTSRRLAELDRTIDWATRMIGASNKATFWGAKYRRAMLGPIFKDLNKARSEKKLLLKEMVR